MSYAGFWKRFLASFLDIIFLIVISVIFMISATALQIPFCNLDYIFHSHKTNEEVYKITIIIIIFMWLYFASFESSKKQATFGKMALRIKVVDMRGRRISFAKASGRFFVKLMNGMVYYLIDIVMIIFSAKKRTLYDMLSDSLVINDKKPINFKMPKLISFIRDIFVSFFNH